MYLPTVYGTQTFLRNIQLIGNYPPYVRSEGTLRWQQRPANWTSPKNINPFLSSNPHLPSVCHMVRFVHSFKFWVVFPSGSCVLHAPPTSFCFILSPAREIRIFNKPYGLIPNLQNEH